MLFFILERNYESVRLNCQLKVYDGKIAHTARVVSFFLFLGEKSVLTA